MIPVFGGGSFVSSRILGNKAVFFGKHPKKFNMEPEDDGLQKESPFLGADFQVPC